MSEINSLSTSRKEFLCQLGKITLGVVGAGILTQCTQTNHRKSSPIEGDTRFKIGLATYSLHRAVAAGEIDNLDFPMIARTRYDIGILEHLNGYFMDKAEDSAYLNEMNRRCADYDVINHLIMCDDEGPLADPDDRERQNAVENHYKWVNAASLLGCQSIRVNVHGEGSAADVMSAGVDGLSRLGEFAADANINILVENHGGYSSNGAWLAETLAKVDRSNVGALTDFGNFCVRGEYYSEDRQQWECAEEYDKYKGIAELIPFAKGISAKSYNFDEEGNCVETDYFRALRIIKDSGFSGCLGIEYEGSELPEDEGIIKTKVLLETVIAELT